MQIKLFVIYGLLSLLPLSAQTTVNVTIQFTIQSNVQADIASYWTDQHAALGPCTLGAAVQISDNTVTISCPGGTQTDVIAGDTILIGSEPAAVSSNVNGLLTLVRGVFPLFNATAHPITSKVFKLMYPTPFAMVAVEAVRPWTQKVIADRVMNNKSVVLPVMVSGTIQ